jgi:hypothetical protein
MHCIFLCADFNPIKIVCGNIKNSAAKEFMSMNFKEMQMICKNYLLSTQQKNVKPAAPT